MALIPSVLGRLRWSRFLKYRAVHVRLLTLESKDYRSFGYATAVVYKYNNTPMNTIYESLECAQDLVLGPPEFLSYFLLILSVYYIIICILVKLSIESLVR